VLSPAVKVVVVFPQDEKLCQSAVINEQDRPHMMVMDQSPVALRQYRAYLGLIKVSVSGLDRREDQQEREYTLE